MPRRYSLGRRAEQQAETRRRIIDAALALYQANGVAATTMSDVAARADVAPGTVANHFGSAEELAREAMLEILAHLDMPTPDLFDGVEETRYRIKLLVGGLAAFFERSEPWYRISQREASDVGTWAEAEARYYRDLDALVRAALGPLSADAEAVAVVNAVLGSWVIGAVQASGRSAETSIGLVSDMLSTWLATREPASSGTSS